MSARASLCACVLAVTACATADQQDAPPPAADQEASGLSVADLLTGGRADAEALPGLVAEAAQHPLGSRDNPVRVNMPPGERAYLARLRCSDQTAPRFQRLGSAGPGVFGSIVDIYQVQCPDAEPRESEIWMDMYHPEHREEGAPPGFTIAPE